ncbi:hypothetical protein [Nannocystis bainbridge]|uniref:Uncharacterized protein n=1 Tax=Nannocystis bainbridge TaxID=2995303 RepID=A0ABT5E370_9BACT|nr:hypothetical protein [Nannocystis bainbridge]MDC0720312.1 hypothetical protein [Nannocystis bainbridge]
MMGARNEDSVLFSLASLGPLDVGRVAEAPVRLAVARRPEPEPEDGSGLIDVRALGGTVQAERPRAARFSELAAGPLPIAPTPVRARARSAPPPMPLYVMIGVAALGMMGLAGFVVTRGATPAPVIIERHISQAPMVVAAAPEPEEAAEAAEPAIEAVIPVVTADAPEPPTSSKRPRKPVNKPATPSADKPAAPKVVTPAAPSGPAADSVECLLAPEGCKTKPAAPVKVDAPAVSSASLPEKLEPGDIADGTRAAKAAALDRCRSHARGGEKVTIKLSIAGPEGTVLSSAPQDDAGNPTLANCAAGELMRASFKKVSKAQIGAVATLKF